MSQFDSDGAAAASENLERLRVRLKWAVIVGCSARRASIAWCELGEVSRQLKVLATCEHG